MCDVPSTKLDNTSDAAYLGLNRPYEATQPDSIDPMHCALILVPLALGRPWRARRPCRGPGYQGGKGGCLICCR